MTLCPRDTRKALTLRSLRASVSLVMKIVYLSVYAPQNKTNLPVLVCHGGRYEQGQASQDMSAIINANKNDLVAIAVQYRVSGLIVAFNEKNQDLPSSLPGTFGFLSSDEVHRYAVVSAGLLDQKFRFAVGATLHWAFRRESFPRYYQWRVCWRFVYLHCFAACTRKSDSPDITRQVHHATGHGLWRLPRRITFVMSFPLRRFSLSTSAMSTLCRLSLTMPLPPPLAALDLLRYPTTISAIQSSSV